MGRPKKDGIFLNCYINAEVYNALQKYADDKGQTKTMAVERLIKDGISREIKKGSKKEMIST